MLYSTSAERKYNILHDPRTLRMQSRWWPSCLEHLPDFWLDPAANTLVWPPSTFHRQWNHNDWWSSSLEFYSTTLRFALSEHGTSLSHITKWQWFSTSRKTSAGVRILAKGSRASCLGFKNLPTNIIHLRKALLFPASHQISTRLWENVMSYTIIDWLSQDVLITLVNPGWPVEYL